MKQIYAWKTIDFIAAGTGADVLHGGTWGLCEAANDQSYENQVIGRAA